LAEAPRAFALAGHSMGGYIAPRSCGRAPERVAKKLAPHRRAYRRRRAPPTMGAREAVDPRRLLVTGCFATRSGACRMISKAI